MQRYESPDHPAGSSGLFTTLTPSQFLASAVAALLLASPVAAQRPTQGTDNPVNLKGWALQQYLNERNNAPPPPRPPLNKPSAHVAPRRSVLQVSQLPYQHAVPQTAANGSKVVVPGAALCPACPVAATPQTGAQRPATAVTTQPVAYVTAHLPPGADLWVEEKLMYSDVQQPEVLLVTPPLEKDKVYAYTVRVRWVEDGKWVGQMHTFDVRAGDMHHIEVMPAGAPAVEKEVAAGLRSLTPEDRRRAESQTFCAVQDTIRLGSMGSPVKVTIGGTEVFLCCKACVDAAKMNPERTLETAGRLKEQKAGPAKE